MALAYRTGVCVATLVAIFFSTVIHSQPNPYQRIEAPNPPLHPVSYTHLTLPTNREV